MPDKLPSGVDDTDYQGFIRGQLATQMRKHPVWPIQDNPKEWYPGQGGVASIFQDEVSSLDPTSVSGIKGANVYRRGVREFMKSSIKGRGSADDVIGRVLRGTWWHGRKNPPKIGNKMVTMEGTRAKGTKFGEPVGTSLTSRPSKASDFAQVFNDYMDIGSEMIKNKLISLSYHHDELKGVAFDDYLYNYKVGDPNLGGGHDFMSFADTDRLKKQFNKEYAPIQAKFDKKEKALESALDKMSARHTAKVSPKIARMFPDYGGRPEDVIIDSTTKEGGAVMKKHYADTLRQMARSGEYDNIKDISRITTPEEHKTHSLSNVKNYADLRRFRTLHPGFKDDFNAIFTANLEKSGYRGVLYSPEARFDEYELKMFPGHGDPSKGSKWAVPVDVRKYASKEVQRFSQSKEKINKQWVEFIDGQRSRAGGSPYNDLSDAYDEVDLKETLGDGEKKGWWDSLFSDESSFSLVSNDPGGFDDDIPF